MPKKGLSYNCPPKRVSTPADLIPLQTAAGPIKTSINKDHAHRMNMADKRPPKPGKSKK